MTPESTPEIAASNNLTKTVTLSPNFNRVFVSVLGLTILALLIGCVLVGVTVRSGREMTPQENVLFDLCTSTFKLGFGAIIGLFGGKAL